MKALVSSLTLCLLLIGCSASNDSPGTARAPAGMGTFDGTLEGKEYKVEVTCSNLDHGDFQFRSDKTDIDDTNGDGIIIYGIQNQGRFLLTLTDHGTTYSSSNIQKFARSSNGAEGEGLLYVDGQADVPYVRFSVDCG